jgi:hypothetical protein
VFGFLERAFMKGRILVVLALFARMAGAQSSGGAISGTVSDQQGAMIPGVLVAIENVKTGEARRVTTSSTGFYSAPNLQTGSYQVSVSAPGFSNLIRKGLEVQVGSELVINLELQVGSATEKVEVEAAAPAVDTATSSIGAVNRGQTVRELPLNGRDWTTLAALQPGVGVIRTQQSPGALHLRSFLSGR